MHKGSVREDAVFQELPVEGWGRADHRLRRAPGVGGKQEEMLEEETGKVCPLI